MSQYATHITPTCTERPVDWSKVEIDTKVLVKDLDVWYRRHFAGLSSTGKPMAFIGGRTSFTVTDKMHAKSDWSEIKLYVEGEDE